jgi:hypothetical protein
MNHARRILPSALFALRYGMTERVHGHPTETDAAKYCASEIEKGNNVEENSEEVQSTGCGFF